MVTRYSRRIVDDSIDELFRSFAAISSGGARAIGKTAPGTQRANTVLKLDLPEIQQLIQANPNIDRRQGYPQQPLLARPSRCLVSRQDDSGTRGPRTEALSHLRHLLLVRDSLSAPIAGVVIVITTGSDAYRRKNGGTVIPLSLLTA